jgi:hypothetical protein
LKSLNEVVIEVLAFDFITLFGDFVLKYVSPFDVITRIHELEVLFDMLTDIIKKGGLVF